MHYSWHKPDFENVLKRRARLPHALLFQGPRGIGKLAFAEALARALLCEQPGTKGEPCGACPSCGWLAQGNHPDVRRLEPEGIADSESGQAGDKREKASSQISV